MPPPVIRYAITNRHLHPADERDPPGADAAARPLQTCHPDQRDRAANPQRRDLHSLATNLQTHIANLEHQAHYLHATATDYLQLREKDLSPADLHTLAIALRRAIPAGQHPRLLLNLGHPADHESTLATALTVSADGLHLPANSPTTPAHLRATFRSACRSTPILSTSAHTLADVAAARAAAVDLILFGPVFGKTVFDQHGQSQPATPATGLAALAAAVQAAGPIPVLALGGITPANAEACLAAGARGLAGIRLFL